MPNNPQDNRGPKPGQTTGKPGADQQDDRRPQSTTPRQGKTDKGGRPKTEADNADEA